VHDPQVQRSAYAKARRLGLLDDGDADDCIQRGFICLWQEMQSKPGLIADKGPVWVGIYVAYAGDSKQFLRYNARRQGFSGPDFDWETADEYLALGLPAYQPERQAAWAQTVDEVHDLQQFMTIMAARYIDDFDKLLTLYALTTTVKIQDVTPLLSVKTNNFAQQYGNAVREEMRAAYLGLNGNIHTETWEERLARGEGVEHIQQIADEVMVDFRQLLALYILTTSVTKVAVLESFGIGKTAFRREMKQVRTRLEAAYRRQ
jgi:hypothetical protein